MEYKVSTIQNWFCNRTNLFNIIADLQIFASKIHWQVVNYGQTIKPKKHREAYIVVKQKSKAEYQVFLNIYQLKRA